MSDATPSGVAAAASTPTAAELLRAVEHWRLVGLQQRKEAMDNEAMAISDQEDRSARARKQLAEKTKALKKCDNTQKLQRLGGVLKGYQDEINMLTARAKRGEDAFLKLFKVLFEASDPLPWLERSVEREARLLKLEKELAGTQQELKEYDSEFQSLKNQEYTVRKLEQEKEALEGRLEGRAAELAQETRASQQEELQEQQRLHNEKLQQAKQELGRLLSQQHEAQAKLEELASQRDSKSAAQDTASDMLEQDLDRAQQQAAALKQENKAIKAEIAALHEAAATAGGGGVGGRAGGGAGWSAEAQAALEAEARGLREQVRELREALLGAEEGGRAAVEEREDRVKAAEAMCEELRLRTAALEKEKGELPQWDTVHRLKQKLRLLRRVEYSLADSEDEEDDDKEEEDEKGAGESSRGREVKGEAGELGEGGKDRETSPFQPRHALQHSPPPRTPRVRATAGERLLLRKNALLESQLAKARARLEEGQQAKAEQQRLLEQAHADSDRHRLLAEKLEEDLSHYGHSTAQPKLPTPTSPASGSQPTAAGASTSLAEAAGAGVGLAGEADATEEAGSRVVAGGDGSASLLQILAGQRDRFKAKVEELEQRHMETGAHHLQLKEQVVRLEKESMELYEKLKYERSYRNARQDAAQDVALDIGSSGGGRGGEGRGGSAERKYASLYEEKHDPFKEFKSSQLLKRVKGLPTSERIVLGVSRLIFRKKSGRTFLFVYALALHLLVFVTMYLHTLTPHCGWEESDHHESNKLGEVGHGGPGGGLAVTGG